jgi:hypothetical protein
VPFENIGASPKCGSGAEVCAVDRSQLESAKAEIQGLNRRITELQDQLRKSVAARSEEEAKKAKLSRSSMEAYGGVGIGIILAVLPMTWYLRLVLFVILTAICGDFCWRSPLTYKWGPWKKAVLCLVVLGAVTQTGVKNVRNAYIDDRFPPNVQYFVLWGGNSDPLRVTPSGKVVGMLASHVTVDGTKAMRYADDYRLWAACFHMGGLVDPNDTPVSGSNLFDIEPRPIEIQIKWSPEFISEVSHGDNTTNYALVLIPKKVTNPSFTTLRDAMDKGGVVLQRTSGPT